MVAISFSEERFVKLIQQGKKDQTIRPYNPKRFEQIKRMKKLQLYYKQRTKECRKIADAELTEIFRIKFSQLNPVEEIWLALRDGFDGIVDFYNWFEKRYGKKLYDMEFMVIKFRITEG